VKINDYWCFLLWS